MASQSGLLLIQHRYLVAGRLMENASAQLAHALPTNPDEQAPHLQQMLEASADVYSLTNGAEALKSLADETV